MAQDIYFLEKLHTLIRRWTRRLQSYSQRIWYPPLIAFLAAIDHWIIVIPNDGILISSAILAPKRWLTLAIWVAAGSTLGAVLLAVLVKFHGLPWILQYYPGLDTTTIWAYSSRIFSQYGLLMVFFCAATPLAQQPAIILAGLANTSLADFALVTLAGRSIKFLFLSYVSAHSPKLLSRLWGIQKEIKDSGMDSHTRS